MGNSAATRFVNLRGKTSIVEFNFIKVVNQNSDTLLSIEFFSERFLKSKGWWHEIKGNLKIKVYGPYLWGCGLNFLRNLGGKSKGTYFIAENFVGGKVTNFSWNSRISSMKIVPNQNFSRWKILPAANIFSSVN